jgi:hypothetical protein
MKRLSLGVLVLLVAAASSPVSAAETLAVKLRRRETRRIAMKDAAQMGDAAIPQLLQLGDDKNESPETRVAARFALAETRSPKAREHLEQRLTNAPEKWDREANAVALGRLKDKKAVPALKAACHDPSGNVRMNAVWALAQLGDKSEKGRAIEALGNQDPSEQRLAVYALEAIGDKSAIAVIHATYDDHPNFFSRLHAHMSILKLQAVGLSDRQKRAHWAKTMEDPQYEIQRFAADELGAMAYPSDGNPDPQALRQLETIVNDSNHVGNRAATKELAVLIEAGQLSVDPQKYWESMGGTH